MRIFLRNREGQNINTATNYEFISGNPTIPLHISLTPIPPFVGEPKCDCGELATVIMNDEIYKCKICMSFLLPQNKFLKSTAISFPITKKTIKELNFEWSGNGEKWYNLWGRNIETKNWDSLLKDIIYMILNNKEIEIIGEYNQETKKMIIY
jgi:hypothetical protein